MSPRGIWPAVVLASVGACVCAVMAIYKVDAATIALIASLMIVPVLTALVTGQLSELKGVTNQLSTQTNGNWSKMIELLANAQPAQNVNTPPSTPEVHSGHEGA